ncbi:VTT domain-containing protein [Brachyspira sp. G79]|uniref:TVP38/TMEM64 family protein n=1 Tax=Brachyspira sp. G79 TaxID=1358104 RepID=UPI000BBC254D|nr:VTT domain-containing protein [Brachyspira sp. G79]PCG20017.1 transporter [Brachyspira sp. G79]
MKLKTKYIKLVIFFAAVIAVIILNYHYKLHDRIHNLEDFRNILGDNIVKASIIYIIITAVGSSVLALPGITFALFSGLLFGPVLGIILCSFSATLAAVISFLIARFFLKDTIKPLVEKNKYLNKLLFEEGNKNAILLLMITRLVPLFPYNIQNFAYGITDVSFLQYSLYTFLFMLPGISFFTIASVGVVSENNRYLYFLIAGVILIFVLAVSLFLKRKYINDKSV